MPCTARVWRIIHLSGNRVGVKRNSRSSVWWTGGLMGGHSCSLGCGTNSSKATKGQAYEWVSAFGLFSNNSFQVSIHTHKSKVKLSKVPKLTPPPGAQGLFHRHRSVHQCTMIPQSQTNRRPHTPSQRHNGVISVKTSGTRSIALNLEYLGAQRPLLRQWCVIS